MNAVMTGSEMEVGKVGAIHIYRRSQGLLALSVTEKRVKWGVDNSSETKYIR